MQHIIVRTSNSHHLAAPDWHVNGAGYKGIPTGLLLNFQLQAVSILEKMSICIPPKPEKDLQRQELDKNILVNVLSAFFFLGKRSNGKHTD